MESPTASFVFVILCVTLTFVCGEGSAPEDTLTTTVDNSPLQRRQDLLDARLTDRVTDINARLNGLQTQLNAQQNEANSRFNRIDTRLDGIETAITDMKDFLQADIRSRQVDKAAETPKVYTGCEDALIQGATCSGVYTVTPDCNNPPIEVYCEQRLDGGGWTVIQSRYDGSVDFYNDWDTYKVGFGNLSGEFWLGNELIHQLTKHYDMQLKIELMGPDGEMKFADYSQFFIGGMSLNYRLTISGYSGSTGLGDAMAHHNGSPFSTRDRDNDRYHGSCAVRHQGGWWYNTCRHSNLNGQFGANGDKGLAWYTWNGIGKFMKATRMMIRKRP